VWALRAHLLERLLELVQLVKAQGLQVNPAIVHACGCGADGCGACPGPFALNKSS
jgi:hypothetical protein